MLFVVPIETSKIVRESSSHISSLFNGVVVSLELSTSTEKSPTSTEEGQLQWVKLSCGPGQSKHDLVKTREYIEALTCPEIEESISGLKIALTDLKRIAKEYSVVTNVSENQNLILKGSTMNVTLAKSWLEQEYKNISTPMEKLSLNDYSRAQSCKNFAIKLGYSEEEVEFAAKTLGPRLDKNKLLLELVNRTRSRAQVDRSRKPVADQIVARGFNPRLMSSNGEGTASLNRSVVARGCTSLPKSSEGIMPATQNRSVVEVSRSSSARHKHEYALADGRSCEAGEDGSISTRSWGHISKPEIANNLRPVIVDASNVAMNHGNHQVFSCLGIELCVKWFQKRGHQEVYALLPRWRKENPRPGTVYQHILLDLEKQGVVKFTPSKQGADGKNIVCYDDRFIVDLAHQLDGVIVSNDTYRDLIPEKPEWKEVIEKRLVMFSFVDDIFMVPDDPLGRYGPTLKELLKKGTNARHPRTCHWNEHGRCTFGKKCKFYHPDKDIDRRPQELPQSDRDEHYYNDSPQYGQPYQQSPQQQHSHHNYQQQQQHQFSHHAQQQQQRLGRHHPQHPLGQLEVHQNVPCYSSSPFFTTETQYSYTPPQFYSYTNSSNERSPFRELIQIFPDKKEKISRMLNENKEIQDVNKLAEMCLDEEN